MLTRLRSERGVAMVTALLVTFVVLLLGTAVIAQAIHNSTASGYDRKRLQSVSAAEAGLNASFNYFSDLPLEIWDVPASITGNVGSGPGGSTYTVTFTYYPNADGTGTPMTPPFSTDYVPKSVRMVSVGSSNGNTPRTMESFAALYPVYAGMEGAIITNSDTTFSNRFTVNGYQGNDGNVYILNGDFNVPSGLETIKGNVYVTNGFANLATQVHVYGDVWATEYVRLAHPQAIVDGDIKSTTASLSVTPGTVGGTGYYCTTVTGAGSIAGGAVQDCTLGNPPTQPFPLVKYYADAWANDDPAYTNFQTFTSCTAARDYIQASGTYVATGFSGRNVGNTVVYIDSTCTFDLSNNATIRLVNNLAIITEGGVNLSQRSNWNGETGLKALHIISAYPQTGSASCPTQNIRIGQMTGFDTHVTTMVYSPCTVTMENNNTAFQGQVIGQSVVIGNNFTMNYVPVKVPGMNIAGFQEDIAYIREARNS